MSAQWKDRLKGMKTLQLPNPYPHQALTRRSVREPPSGENSYQFLPENAMRGRTKVAKPTK